MLETLAVFHLDTSLLKTCALLNICAALTTLATFQFDTLPLNAVLENICAAFETLAVFHLEISASLPPVNIFWLLKSWPMLVTRDVSQPAMGPYVAEAVAAFVIHAVTAVLMLASVIPS